MGWLLLVRYINANTILAGFYVGDARDYWHSQYKPLNDSKYRRLVQKPINTLTADEVKYIWAVQQAWYEQEIHQYENADEFYENYYNSRGDKFLDADFETCANWLHTLTFPLTIYRAIWESQDISDVYGGKHISWTIDPKLYTASNSSFRTQNKIVVCEIDNPKLIDVRNTINNFMYYTLNPSYGRYAESEITLKSTVKQSDLKGLRYISRDELLKL